MWRRELWLFRSDLALGYLVLLIIGCFYPALTARMGCPISDTYNINLFVQFEFELFVINQNYSFFCTYYQVVAIFWNWVWIYIYYWKSFNLFDSFCDYFVNLCRFTVIFVYLLIILHLLINYFIKDIYIFINI